MWFAWVPDVKLQAMVGRLACVWWVQGDLHMVGGGVLEGPADNCEMCRCLWAMGRMPNWW